MLGLVLVVAAGVALDGADGAGECGRASADRVALRLAPCISAADDPQSTPTSSCCSAVHAIGQSPSCLCAVMLSGTAGGRRDQAGGRHYHPEALQHGRSPRRLQVRRYVRVF